MKYVRTAAFALLLISVLTLSFKMNEQNDMLDKQQGVIERLNKSLTESEITNQKKDEYIKELHESVDSLQSNVETLENKLNELSVFKDKLK